VGNETKEVTIGVAMLGRVSNNNPIPAEYTKVLVREITDMACIDYPLDHVMPEGIKELGEAVNQFILCNRREIVLDGPTTPQNQFSHGHAQWHGYRQLAAGLPTMRSMPH
jgi:hypothetical protein